MARAPLTVRGYVEWLAGLDPDATRVQVAQVIGWAQEALRDEDGVPPGHTGPVPPQAAPPPLAPQPSPPPLPPGPPPQGAPAPWAPQPAWGPPPPQLNQTTGGMFSQAVNARGPDMTNDQIAAQRGAVPSPYFDPHGTVGEKKGIIQGTGSGLLPAWDALSAAQRIEHHKSLPRWAQEMLWSQMSHTQRRKFQQQRMNRPWTQF